MRDSIELGREWPQWSLELRGTREIEIEGHLVVLENAGCHCNGRTQKQWAEPTNQMEKVKEDLEEIAIKITEEEERKVNRIIEGGTPILKSSLKNMENEKLDRETESAQAWFLNEGERCSKYWFALNKPKEPSNIILGLQNEEGTIQTETRKMVDIASKCYKLLQESH